MGARERVWKELEEKWQGEEKRGGRWEKEGKKRVERQGWKNVAEEGRGNGDQ